MQCLFLPILPPLISGSCTIIARHVGYCYVSALKRQHFRHIFGIFSGKHAPFLLFFPTILLEIGSHDSDIIMCWRGRTLWHHVWVTLWPM